MDRFPKFDMIVKAPALLKMWYNDLNAFHKRDLNKYVGALTELINMVGWPELVEVLTSYWDNERIVFWFGTMEITPTTEKIRDEIDTVGTGLERRVRKQESILIPNKPTLEDIINCLGLRKDYAYWVEGSSISFRDLYVRFGHANFYANYNQEFKVTFKEWDRIRPLAFTIVLLGTITRVIMLAHTLFHGHLNQGEVKYYPIAPVILSDMYRALGRCKEGHRYFQGYNLFLQWWILSHLAKGHGTQQLHTLDNNNSLKGLNDVLFWADLENRKTRGKWAHIFSELRESDIQWMFDRFISKDITVQGHRQLVLSLPGIRGIRPTIQITPPKAYYRIYVFDVGDDRVHEASEMLREWKKAVRMDEKTIVVDRFNAGYDQTYKAWLKDDIQGISFPVPNIYCSVEDKESKALIELREVKKEAQEMHNEFLRKQEEVRYALESVTHELESLRSDLGELNLWIRDKKSGMCLEDWEEKGRRSEGYLLMIQYKLQHLMAQNKRSSSEAGW
ncbi:hypothetical protein R3W88_031709 [Solanum pinnatisectum]|uniref:Aminotransferase-like plant mobile domain-containing protein n=1 Tax=Solanum pinnatisectum TaxID=50273 RepID=A0AAV9LR11_9SOLN|nr:hypothetical protein R3W88_031709 [Solanum pinnatisectum]